MPEQNKNLNTLEEIGKLPIFKLSLGSKELFHSNFLEFLWEFNKSCFIGMINELLKKGGKSISLTSSSNLGREKEHFDLCLFHEEGKNKRIVYDLILENKVKSIPDKGQLDRYVGDIKEKRKGEKSPVFLLLSLAKDFPSRKEIEEEEKWTVVSYSELAEAIKNQKWPRENTGYNYIGDYIAFIEKLHLLGTDILANLMEEYLFQDVEAYKKERMHDLYIKLRGSHFIVSLYDRLKNEQPPIPITFVPAFKWEDFKNEIVKTAKKKHVFLNLGYNQGNGQIAAWIYDGSDDAKPRTFEVVIQGDQYRHGISLNREVAKDNEQKANMLNELWGELSIKYGNFLNLEGIKDSLHQHVMPDKQESNFRFKNEDSGKPYTKKGPFDCYGDSYVYRYIKISTQRADDLLDTMSRDIINVFNNILP